VLTGSERVAPAWQAWLRALRLHQWSKNLLVFVPLIVGHSYDDPGNITAVLLAVLILCLATSAGYIANDIADIEADRSHATKRSRPFASGRLPIASGIAVAAVLAMAALAAAFVLSRAFALVLVIYLAGTLAYSFGLKRKPLLDTFVIGGLLTLRIVMGTAVIGVGYSPWLLSFSAAFFLSLALAKRHGEVMRAVRDRVPTIDGRGYRADDWPLTLTFGVGAGLVSILIMLLYLTNDASPSGFYTMPAFLYAAPATVSIWLMRMWLLSHRGELNDDPVVFALTDPTSLGLGLLVAAAFALSI
jgi:4-hydroxybenzoate polyprenyltransferase